METVRRYLPCKISSTRAYLAFAGRSIRQTAKALGDERHVSSREMMTVRRGEKEREGKRSEQSLHPCCAAPNVFDIRSLLLRSHSDLDTATLIKCSDKTRAREKNGRTVAYGVGGRREKDEWMVGD